MATNGLLCCKRFYGAVEQERSFRELRDSRTCLMNIVSDSKAKGWSPTGWCAKIHLHHWVIMKSRSHPPWGVVFGSSAPRAKERGKEPSSESSRIYRHIRNTFPHFSALHDYSLPCVRFPLALLFLALVIPVDLDMA